MDYPYDNTLDGIGVLAVYDRLQGIAFTIVKSFTIRVGYVENLIEALSNFCTSLEMNLSRW